MLGYLSRRCLVSAVHLLLLGAVVVDSKSAGLGIKNAKIAVSSPDGLHDVTYQLEPPTTLPQPIILSDQSTLRLTFTSIDASSQEPIFPQQAHLLFEDPKGDDVTLPVNVKSNGKASWTFVSRRKSLQWSCCSSACFM